MQRHFDNHVWAYGFNSLTSLNSPFAKVELIIEFAKVQKVIVQMVSYSEMAGIEEAMDDIRHGRVTEYKSADDMFEKQGR